MVRRNKCSLMDVDDRGGFDNVGLELDTVSAIKQSSTALKVSRITM